MVGRSISEELQVIGSVLVVRGNKESHYLLQELFRGLVVAEESVPVHEVAEAGSGAQTMH